MIHQLKADQYRKVLPLFEGLTYKLVTTAVIEGTAPGRIYVEDVVDPRTAFLWGKGHEFYLVGRENNDDFNSSVSSLLLEDIFPEAMRAGRVAYVFRYPADAWERAISDVILKDRHPIKEYRRLFTFKGPRVDWKGRISAGSCMKRVDENLLERNDLENVTRVADEIHSQSISIDDFIRRLFGFCLLHEDTIVSWCLAEYLSGGNCGVGIETDESYRNRGVATLTASAFVDYCVANGITPYWDCWDSNLPSAAVAEKVGFEMAARYAVYFGWFNEVDNLIVNGNVSLGRKEFGEAAEWYERAFEIAEAGAGDSPDSRLFTDKGSRAGWYYYNAACAWASAGDSDAALRNLGKAIDKGWRDIERAKGDERSRRLRETEGWQELISRLEMEISYTR